MLQSVEILHRLQCIQLQASSFKFSTWGLLFGLIQLHTQWPPAVNPYSSIWVCCRIQPMPADKLEMFGSTSHAAAAEVTPVSGEVNFQITESKRAKQKHKSLRDMDFKQLCFNSHFPIRPSSTSCTAFHNTSNNRHEHANNAKCNSEPLLQKVSQSGGICQQCRCFTSLCSYCRSTMEAAVYYVMADAVTWDCKSILLEGSFISKIKQWLQSPGPGNARLSSTQKLKTWSCYLLCNTDTLNMQDASIQNRETEKQRQLLSKVRVLHKTYLVFLPLLCCTFLACLLAWAGLFSRLNKAKALFTHLWESFWLWCL